MKAIIFDMDGTLINSEALYDDINARIFAPLGIPEGTLANQYRGVSAEEMLVDIEKRYDVHLTPQEYRKQRKPFIASLYVEDAELAHGAYDLLERLTDAGVPLALCTNTDRDRVLPALKHFSLQRFFDCVFTFDDVDQPKPAPDMHIAAAKCLGFPPEDCVVVEDSAPGLKAARAAGCKAVLYRTEFNQEIDDSAADAVIVDFSQINKQFFNDL